MKLPDFEYAAPTSLSDAIALLASRRGSAKPLAGGQSLLPAMAFRLATPALLVDLRNIPALDRIEIDDDEVRLGARVRWCDIERDTRLATAHPLLSAAIQHVAHYPIRNRGTVGGSLCHADPAAELPGVAVTCDARIELEGPGGRRVMDAGDFLLGPLSTAIAADELLVRICLPAWPAGRRWAFDELARRRGDFAMAGVALYYDVDASGRARNAHIGVIGANPRPRRLTAAEAQLNGSRLNHEVSRPAPCASPRSARSASSGSVSS